MKNQCIFTIIFCMSVFDRNVNCMEENRNSISEFAEKTKTTEKKLTLFEMWKETTSNNFSLYPIETTTIEVKKESGGNITCDNTAKDRLEKLENQLQGEENRYVRILVDDLTRHINKRRFDASQWWSHIIQITKNEKYKSLPHSCAENYQRYYRINDEEMKKINDMRSSKVPVYLNAKFKDVKNAIFSKTKELKKVDTAAITLYTSKITFESMLKDHYPKIYRNELINNYGIIQETLLKELKKECKENYISVDLASCIIPEETKSLLLVLKSRKLKIPNPVLRMIFLDVTLPKITLNIDNLTS